MDLRSLTMLFVGVILLGACSCRRPTGGAPAASHRDPKADEEPDSRPDSATFVAIMGWRRHEEQSEEAWRRAEALLSSIGAQTLVESSLGWSLSVRQPMAAQSRQLLMGDPVVRPFVVDASTGVTFGGPRRLIDKDPTPKRPMAPIDIILRWYSYDRTADAMLARASELLKGAHAEMYMDHSFGSDWLAVDELRAGEARELLLGDPITRSFVVPH